MQRQTIEIAGSGVRAAAAKTAAFLLLLSIGGAARAGDQNQGGSSPAPTTPQTQNVNVVNTPTVNVGNTPTVNANVSFPANQNVTVNTAGPLTNVGRLPSQQVMIEYNPSASCSTLMYSSAPDGTNTCFNMANHAGQVLVITDIFWIGFGTSGNTCTIALSAGFGATLYGSGAVMTADGVAAKSDHLTTGVKMSVNPVFAATGSSCAFIEAVIQGYLLPNQ